MSTWKTALRLQATAATAVSEGGHDDIVITLDDREVGPALEAGAHVVLITPPRIEATGQAIEVATWKAFIISAVRDDPADFWPLLDDVAETLADPLEVDESDFYMWRTPTGNEYPARQITFTT